jgi:hypothetical protein
MVHSLTDGIVRIANKRKMEKKEYKDVKKMIDHHPEIIGYLVEKDYIVVTNPCKIPIAILEKQLKEIKKHPVKEGESMFIGVLQLSKNHGK